ncbi:MAG: hypothetical protein WBC70_00110 [Candidatus Aminicenantales bacterium]
MRRQLLAACIIISALCACTRVIISKHPGYDFPATDPDSILAHDRTAPDYPFVIIGRISLDMTWTINPGRDEKKIEKMAARAGADGIIVSGLDINIDAFNRHVATQGYASVSGTDLSEFVVVTRPHALYLEQSRIYGYIIKRTG